jgi:hypothetical protein
VHVPGRGEGNSAARFSTGGHQRRTQEVFAMVIDVEKAEEICIRNNRR